MIKNRGNICFLLISSALMISGCDQGGKGRIYDPSQGNGTQSQQQSTRNFGYGNSSNSARQDMYGQTLEQDRRKYNECTQQCVRDNTGELISDCPDYCSEYIINYTRGVPYDQDLNPLISFQSAYGASRLGGTLSAPNMRQQLTSQYFQGNPSNFYRQYNSYYMNSLYPNGSFCPEHRDDCEDKVIRNPNDVYNLALLDTAAYKYQIGDPNAGNYYYSIQNNIRANAGGKVDFNFDQLGAQFKGMGHAILGGLVNSGQGLVNSFTGMGYGLANSMAMGAGNMAAGVSQYRFGGFSWNYNPYQVSHSVNNLSYSAMYGRGPDRCSPQNQNDPYYYYACAQNGP